jgi:hypothetical protein
MFTLKSNSIRAHHGPQPDRVEQLVTLAASEMLNGLG